MIIKPFSEPNLQKVGYWRSHSDPVCRVCGPHTEQRGGTKTQQRRLGQAQCDEADEKEPTGKQPTSTVYRLPGFPQSDSSFLDTKLNTSSENQPMMSIVRHICFPTEVTLGHVSLTTVEPLLQTAGLNDYRTRVASESKTQT